MRQLVVLIQNVKSSEFLKADNSWTTEISQAFHFPDIDTAFSHMRESGLPHLQVFVIPRHKQAHGKT
jgi:hypothetical protein